LLGLAHHHLNEFDEALLYYEKSLTLKPDFHIVWANIGAVYLALGLTTNAVNSFQRALEHTPNDVGVLNNYGALLGCISFASILFIG